MRMLNESRLLFVRGKIVAVCQAILNEEMGVIAGSRILCGLEFELRYDLYRQYDCDEDFTTFIAINSETDHLPVDRERINWSAEALARKDREIAEAEAFYRASCFEACHTLVARFDMKNNT